MRPFRGWRFDQPGCGGENCTRSVRFQFFFSGAEVANSYEHAFRRNGINSRKRYNICERLAYKKKGLQKLCRIFKGMHERVLKY